MEILTTEQVRGLIAASTPPCVSIFMPTHRQGRDTRQDPVQLKNLLKSAEEQLEARGMRPSDARELLEPGRLLLDDHHFWQHSNVGLVIYLAPDFFRAYRVPIELDDVCTVNDRFDVKPLLPLLESRQFYIVAISDEHVRLLECTPRTWREVALPEDVALSLDEAVPGEKEHKDRTEHRGRNSAPNPMAGGGSFHGIADNIQVWLQEDRRFFYRQVDDGVRRVVRDEKATVLLAAADPTAPAYYHVSEMKAVRETFIHGNPEHVTSEQLHKQACEILQDDWHKELIELQEQYGNALARQLASNDVREIVPAASMGRVGILFVSTENSHWGRVGENNEVIEGDDEGHLEDLIDRAAVETLLTNGQLVVVPPDQVPGNGELAAIYRY
jgi:hypothetical protein